MKILPNGECVIEGDMLSEIVERKGGLSLIDDGARSENLRHLHPGDWVVDGGAAIGDHTIEYLRAVSPGGKVIAFEPNPEMFSCLVRNCPGCTAYPDALSDTTGHVEFNKETLPNLGASHCTRGGKLSVRTVRLDDLKLPRLNLLKLDIEGYELRALLGATETICRHNPLIQCEWNPPAMIRSGCNPGSIFEWFRICEYDFKFFMGDTQSGGEIFATPKTKCTG